MPIHNQLTLSAPWSSINFGKELWNFPNWHTQCFKVREDCQMAGVFWRNIIKQQDKMKQLWRRGTQNRPWILNLPPSHTNLKRLPSNLSAILIFLIITTHSKALFVIKLWEKPTKLELSPHERGSLQGTKFWSGESFSVNNEDSILIILPFRFEKNRLNYVFFCPYQLFPIKSHLGTARVPIAVRSRQLISVRTF